MGGPPRHEASRAALGLISSMRYHRCMLLVLLLGFFGVADAQGNATASGKKAPTESEMAEYKQDFIDFDLNKDQQIDTQEVRSQFKGDLDPKELHQFFIDVDKDGSGTVTLEEYVSYAATLGGSAS